MQSMESARERISQLVWIRVGSNMPPMKSVAEDFDEVAGILDRFPIGGLLLFNGGPAAECAETIERLQRRASSRLLVSSDMERGSGQQVIGHTLWSHCLAFDALGDEAREAVRTFAQLSSEQAHSIGVHAFLGPVADIHSNPKNPIIATRSFGKTADRVAELTAAFVLGCREAGILTCAKHFPGHGNTIDDSHASLPVVNEAADALTHQELAPFQHLIHHHVDMMMTAHVAYPALDPSGQPATLSRPILTDLLRDQMGFGGVVVSDSLKMEGVHVGHNRTEAELAKLAIMAGVDVLLDVSDVAGVIRVLSDAYDAEATFRAQADQAFQRTWQMKQRAFAAHKTKQSANGASTTQPQVDVARADQHARRVAQRSLTVLDNQGNVDVPIGDKTVYAALVNPYGDGAYTRTNRIRDAFIQRSQVVASSVLTDTAAAPIANALREAEAAELCFVAIVVKPAAWRSFGMPPELHQFVQELTRIRPTVIASLGIGETLHEFSDAACRVALFSDVPAAQEALTDWLWGSPAA